MNRRVGLAVTIAASCTLIWCVGNDPAGSTPAAENDGGGSSGNNGSSSGNGSSSSGNGTSTSSSSGGPSDAGLPDADVSIPDADADAGPIVLTTRLTVVDGDRTSCVLLSDGQVDCWGDNQLGQLGTGYGADPKPVKVGVSDAIRLTATRFGECALHKDRTISCWGYNKLGTGGAESRCG